MKIISKYLPLFILSFLSLPLQSAPNFTPEELEQAKKELQINQTIQNLYTAQRFDNMRIIPREMDKLKALAPESPEIPYFQGLLYYRDGELVRAGLEFEKAITIDPAFDAAWNIMGLMLLDAGRTDEAENAFRKAALASPYNPSYIYNLSNLLYRKEELPEAELYARLSIEFKPNFSDAHYLLGLIFLKKNLDEDAIHEFELAYSEGLRTEEFLVNYLETSDRMGFDEQSLKIVGSLSKTKSLEALRIHGNLRMKYGEFKTASSVYYQLVQLEDSNTEDRKLYLRSLEGRGLDPYKFVDKISRTEDEKQELNTFISELKHGSAAPALKDPIMHPIQ